MVSIYSIRIRINITFKFKIENIHQIWHNWIWWCEWTCVCVYFAQSLSIVSIFWFQNYFVSSSHTKRSTPFAWSFNSTTAMKRNILTFRVAIKECDICETNIQSIWRWKWLINFFLCIFFFTLILPPFPVKWLTMLTWPMNEWQINEHKRKIIDF